MNPQDNKASTDRRSKAVQQNATYLFRRYPNSESFWTSLFAMLLLYLSANKSEIRIQLWEYSESSSGWRYSPTQQTLKYEGLGIGNIAVEQDLGQALDRRRAGVKPDLLLRDPSGAVTLIENKTIGSEIGDQIVQYKIALQRCDCKTGRVFLLVSLGYEGKDWRSLYSKKEMPSLVLWEDVLEVMADDRLPFARLLDFNATQYCEKKLEGRWQAEPPSTGR